MKTILVAAFILFDLVLVNRQTFSQYSTTMKGILENVPAKDIEHED